MARMYQIETAIGEDNRPPFAPMRRDFDQEFIKRSPLAAQLSFCEQYRVMDLLKWNRLHAKDFDFQPRCSVGKADCIAPVDTVGPRSSKRRQHHIPRARHVVHLARNSRHTHRFTVPLRQDGAVPIKRQRHRVQIKLTSHCIRKRRHLHILSEPQRTRRLQRLRPVGSHARCACIPRIFLQPCWIDKHRNASSLAPCDDLLAQSRRADPLAIIFDADNVGAGQSGIQLRQ